MCLLNIIDKIYSNSHFTTILVVSIIILIILFGIVLFLGIRDAKGENKKDKNKKEELKDITFGPIDVKEKVNEDVTFEMPSITENLENFKKNLEEELKQDENKDGAEPEEGPYKVTEVNEIENTTAIPVVDEKKEDVFDITDKLASVNEHPEDSFVKVAESLQSERTERGEDDDLSDEQRAVRDEQEQMLDDYFDRLKDISESFEEINKKYMEDTNELDLPTLKDD